MAQTPGPWNVCEPTFDPPKEGFKLSPDRFAGCWWIGTRPGTAVALVDVSDGPENAYLIQQAPDMLDALERLATFAEELCIDAGVSKFYPSIENARKVIARAKGQSK